MADVAAVAVAGRDWAEEGGEPARRYEWLRAEALGEGDSGATPLWRARFKRLGLLALLDGDPTGQGWFGLAPVREDGHWSVQRLLVPALDADERWQRVGAILAALTTGAGTQLDSDHTASG